MELGIHGACRHGCPVSTRQRIVISLLLATAVVGLVVAFQSSQEPTDVVIQRDSRVLAVFPKERGTILRQDTIYAEVTFPYTGALRVDGVEIPDAQLQRIQVGSATRIAYTPGPTSVTGYLRPGDQHTAELEFWNPERGRDTSARYSWRFAVN